MSSKTTRDHVTCSLCMQVASQTRAKQVFACHTVLSSRHKIDQVNSLCQTIWFAQIGQFAQIDLGELVGLE